MLDLRKSLERPVSEYMSTNFTRVSFEQRIVDAAKAMKEADKNEMQDRLKLYEKGKPYRQAPGK